MGDLNHPKNPDGPPERKFEAQFTTHFRDQLDPEVARRLRNTRVHFDQSTLDVDEQLGDRLAEIKEYLESARIRVDADHLRQIRRLSTRVREVQFKDGTTFLYDREGDEPVLVSEPTTEARDAGGAEIERPVGHLALRLTDLFYSRETYENVFEAAILDHRAEYHEALAEGDRTKARMRKWQLVPLVAGLALRHTVQKLVKPFEPVLKFLRPR